MDDFYAALSLDIDNEQRIARTKYVHVMAINVRTARAVEAALHQLWREVQDTDYPPLNALRAATHSLEECILIDAFLTYRLLAAGEICPEYPLDQWAREPWSSGAAEALSLIGRSRAVAKLHVGPPGWWPAKVPPLANVKLSEALGIVMADVTRIAGDTK